MQIRFSAGFRLDSAWLWAWVVLVNEPVQDQGSQSSATCLCKPTSAAIPFALAGLFEQLLDETRCFQFVQRLHSLPKTVLGQSLNLRFLQVLLIDDFDDEVSLFVGAVPGTILGRLVHGLVVPIPIPVAALTGTLSIVVAVAVAVAVAIPVRGQVTDFFDGRINSFLEQFIQPGALGLHLVEVRDFCSECDRELM